VFSITAKSRNSAFAGRVISALRARIVIVPASDDLVMAAASLKAQYRMSYADGFAAATAIALQCPLATGDPELRAVAEDRKELRLEWLGSRR
jgi:predicted nucleic acid-binding protein